MADEMTAEAAAGGGRSCPAPRAAIPCLMYARRPGSLAELLSGTGRWAEREFLVQGERRLSYGAFTGAVARVAAHLRGLGVAPGQRIMLLGLQPDRVGRRVLGGADAWARSRCSATPGGAGPRRPRPWSRPRPCWCWPASPGPAARFRPPRRPASSAWTRCARWWTPARQPRAAAWTGRPGPGPGRRGRPGPDHVLVRDHRHRPGRRHVPPLGHRQPAEPAGADRAAAHRAAAGPPGHGQPAVGAAVPPGGHPDQLHHPADRRQAGLPRRPVRPRGGAAADRAANGCGSGAASPPWSPGCSTIPTCPAGTSPACARCRWAAPRSAPSCASGWPRRSRG